ncbi:glycoside hydrolase family 13 protein [Desmospora profundinema]|uniref:glycoside hydrolase family 13 protein n=1 Tax=Desmospora profundinema TaxID=1571184 RepID=UPI00286B801F|nr:alpha-glucosidase [Desmospora profundinema]
MQKKWWKESVVYQIYPRSFNDSNGDGIGDLQGIIEKLDYLSLLGVDVIWLSPVYRSPNDDNGYDISDYRAIMDEFGTMEDWETLLKEVHARGLKLIMDLVVNHTSDEHSWFLESRSSKDNPRRKWYWWRPGVDGGEPNNWGSVFSGPAWTFDETTGEYYLHLFSRKQPDLNWENPEVREAIYDMMRWWLEKGIDGFRMDVINFISKVPELPDGFVPEGEKYGLGAPSFMNGPRIHEFLREMNRKVLSNYDIMTVGEMPGVDVEEAVRYTGKDREELNMVFQFEHMELDSGSGGKWDLRPLKLTDLKQSLTRWQKELEGRGWNSLYWNNHDQPRIVSRWGDDGKYRVKSAKMLATLLHMMQGTPYVYQGEELGMTNVRFNSIDHYRDIETLNMYREKVADGWDPKAILHAIHVKGRDNARTPIQWNDSDHAGFTDGTPWIPVNPNFHEINAEQALKDPDSVFHHYRKLIALRKEHPIIVYGTYDLILPDHDRIFAYTRTLGREKLLVVCNFYGEETRFCLPEEIRYREKELLIANDKVDEAEGIRSFPLRPYEARVYKLS